MLKHPLFLLYLAIFINSLGFGIIFPLLPFYAKSFQASEITIGLLASSYAISQLFFSPIWGRLSDRYGRKPII
ncbi:MAG: MFS transporter, partial [bacterium]|nr:MFS transporter [bacterium]